MSKCLYCYKELGPGEVDYHKSCCRKFFGTTTVPSLEYTRAQMDELAAQVRDLTFIGRKACLIAHIDEFSVFHYQSRGLGLVFVRRKDFGVLDDFVCFHGRCF